MNEMIDKIDLRDSFGVKGFVVIQDKNGNVIFKGHNLITNSGKRVLMDCFLGNGSCSISSIRISSNPETPTADDEISIMNKNGNLFFDIIEPEITTDKNTLKFSIDIDTNKFNTPSDMTAMNSLGIVVNENVLFSRIAFDTIPLRQGDSYSLSYYVYF